MHAPDPQLQRECLLLIGAAVCAGEAAAQDWATLLDRVLLHEGRAQVFGTQLTTQDRAYRPEEMHATTASTCSAPEWVSPRSRTT